MRILSPLFCFALGAFLDFVVFGVAEVTWAVVYVPLFVAAASILYAQILHSPWRNQAKMSTAALILGAACARLALANQRRVVTYEMAPVIEVPLVLKPAAGSRTLVVSSDALQKDFSKNPPLGKVAVLVEVTTDYGCITSFLVSSVAGVEIQKDQYASWTWRSPDNNSAEGPGLEDQRLPWCRFHLYRR